MIVSVTVRKVVYLLLMVRAYSAIEENTGTPKILKYLHLTRKTSEKRFPKGSETTKKTKGLADIFGLLKSRKNNLLKHKNARHSASRFFLVITFTSKLFKRF